MCVSYPLCKCHTFRNGHRQVRQIRTLLLLLLAFSYYRRHKFRSVCQVVCTPSLKLSTECWSASSHSALTAKGRNECILDGLIIVVVGDQSQQLVGIFDIAILTAPVSVKAHLREIITISRDVNDTGVMVDLTDQLWKVVRLINAEYGFVFKTKGLIL